MQILLEDQEHERIKNELTQYANSIGYTKKVKFNNGMEPDVLYLNVDGDSLFMGEAKDSANETPSNSKTAERIYGYIKTFRDCLTAGLIKRGFIAISTNDIAVANDWKTWLNAACKKIGFTDPDFTIKTISANTYLIYW
jgi:hypothetical protein